MDVIFAGTPDFAVPSLQALIDSEHRVRAVYTQPDRPAGRGRKAATSPVKQLAQHHQLRVEQPDSLKSTPAIETLKAFGADIMVVVAYGQILPESVLNLFPRGCVNVHASLLPRWRGAAPIQRAIEAGDTETGITIMQMARGLDTGDILSQSKTPIGSADTAGALHDRLAQMGGDLLIRTLNEIAGNQHHPKAQDDRLATYAAKLSKGEAAIDWQQPASVLARQIRAFNPWPVAFCHHDNKKLRIWTAETLAQTEDSTHSPGTVVAGSKVGIDVQTSEGILRLTRLQAEGGRVMPAADFLNGHMLSPGDRLD